MIFLTIYMICFLFLFTEQKQYDKALEEKEKIEQALVKAVENTGMVYKKYITATEEKRKKELEKAFFTSFYVSAGVFDKKEQQEKLRMYLPMLVLAEEDGAYFLFMQEITSDGVEELRHSWSDKISYGYGENITEAQKKNAVAGVLEEQASEIISNHNYIAEQYGISYSFYVPDFLNNTTTSLEFPMIFAVFQGWPLTVSGNILYDNCLDSAVYLQKVKNYVVTGPEGLLQPNCQYHDITCGLLTKTECTIWKEYVTEMEAIAEYGALPCKTCIP